MTFRAHQPLNQFSTRRHATLKTSRKASHVLSKMGKKRKQLSHAEIWDDTALLQSWNDALEEYKVLFKIKPKYSQLANLT